MVLIERIFQRKAVFILHVMIRMLSSHMMQSEIIIYDLVRTCVKLSQAVGTNCVPLIADLFLFCYERGFMLSLSEDNQSDVIEAFNSTSLYLYDLLNIDNNFFDSMVNRIYSSELKLNKTNMSDTEASFLDLHLSIWMVLLRPIFTINEMILILILCIFHF